MNMNLFDVIYKLILEHEGGKCNNSNDPGGKTNKGITQRTYDAQRREIIQSNKFSKEKIPKQKDVYDLTEEEIKDFYKYQFERYSAYKIENPETCYVFFDTVINTGPGNATRFVQRACNLKEDGIFGTETQKNANSIDQKKLQEQILNYRLDHYKGSIGYAANKNGWNNRINKIRQQIKNGIMPIIQQNQNNNQLNEMFQHFQFQDDQFQNQMKQFWDNNKKKYF